MNKALGMEPMPRALCHMPCPMQLQHGATHVQPQAYLALAALTLACQDMLMELAAYGLSLRSATTRLHSFPTIASPYPPRWRACSCCSNVVDFPRAINVFVGGLTIYNNGISGTAFAPG